ncbi:MAG: ABC transporter ATP-binding protein [Acidobacteriaceae bacterium]|nr:ABC transporter ATP-binding protein [Acidobacteriaceae bacterium]
MHALTERNGGSADCPAIQIVKLSKRYRNGITALDRITLCIRAGEIFCLLGANGAGKSSLMNCLLGFTAPTSGEASIKGFDCHKQSLEVKKFVSYIPENVALHGSFTARETLILFGQLGGAGRLTDKLCEEALERAGLTPRAFRQPIHEFSKGMRQKLAIAVALVRRSQVILLDEPMSGLDPKAMEEFTGIVESLRSQKCAVLMTTHDLFRARIIADRVGIMKEGRLVLEKTGRELLDEPLEALYTTVMSAHR